MQGSKSVALAELRQQIDAIERRPALAGADPEPEKPPGFLEAPRGVVHEVFADELRDGGAALGFAFAQARNVLSRARPAVLFLQLVGDAQETGIPYALGLEGFGLGPEAVVMVRPNTIVELLWSIEEAVACRAVAAVVADFAHFNKALDFTASRRLSLRAAEAAGVVLLVRYAREREASAAKFRWRVEPAPSPPPAFDPRAPGPPRWRVVLEKGQLGRRRAAGTEILVDWTDNGFVPADRSGSSGAAPRRDAAHSRAAPAAVGDRLPQTG